MEKKLTKKEKGITLVALIITIIVLLILAVVSIRAITGDNILGKAEAGKEKYESAKSNENLRLDEYSAELDKNSKKSNAKFYKEENIDYDIIYKISSNKYECYIRRKNQSEEKYKIFDEDIRTITNLETKVMISDNNIHYYSNAAVIEISNSENYQSDDIIINNLHYTTSDIILISNTEMIIDPNRWYYKDENESEMEQPSTIRIANSIEDFDETLLSDEPFRG